MEPLSKGPCNHLPQFRDLVGSVSVLELELELLRAWVGASSTEADHAGVVESTTTYHGRLLGHRLRFVDERESYHPTRHVRVRGLCGRFGQGDSVA